MLGRKLLIQYLIVVGTIRKNRMELPADFVSTKTEKNPLYSMAIKKEAMVVSYGPKKRKVVTFLSTMHSDKGTESTSHYVLQRNEGRCRYHGPNGEMVYFQKKKSKMAHGNILFITCWTSAL